MNVDTEFSITFHRPDVPAVEHFVGRKKELEDLRSALVSCSSGRNVAVLHGLGGIGKTQLAARFMSEQKRNFTAILWFNGKSVETLGQSFTDVARRLVEEHSSLPFLKSALQERDVEQTIRHVKRWLSLESNTKWLLVFDNVDNPKLPGASDPNAYDVRLYFPESETGSILVTTRSSNLKIGSMINVKKLEEVKDGMSILTNVSGLPLDRGKPLI